MIDQQTKEKILAKLSGDRTARKQTEKYINWAIFGTTYNNYQKTVEEKLETIIKNTFKVVYPFIDLIDSANIDIIQCDRSELGSEVFFHSEFSSIGRVGCRATLSYYIPVDFSEIYTEVKRASCLSEAFLVYLKDETLVKNLMKELEDLNTEITTKLTELAKLKEKLKNVHSYWDLYVLVGDSLFEYLAYCVKYKLTCPIDSSYFQPSALSVKDKLKAINSFFVY